MKRTTIMAAAVVVAVGLGSVLLLRQYKLELIHLIVENAVIQKAPDDYPESRIREAFDQSLQRAEASGREEIYLDRLLQASQRLEKIQVLSATELDRLLLELDPGSED
jgi:hypothetical protein